MKATRVVVVEDSLVQRAHLVRTLQADGDIAVVGEAASAAEAIRVVRAAAARRRDRSTSRSPTAAAST